MLLTGRRAAQIANERTNECTLSAIHLTDGRAYGWRMNESEHSASQRQPINPSEPSIPSLARPCVPYCTPFLGYTSPISHKCNGGETTVSARDAKHAIIIFIMDGRTIRRAAYVLRMSALCTCKLSPGAVQRVCCHVIVKKKRLAAEAVKRFTRSDGRCEKSIILAYVMRMERKRRFTSAPTSPTGRASLPRIKRA